MSEDAFKGIVCFAILVLAFEFFGAIGFVFEIAGLLFDALVAINYAIYEALGDSLLSGMFKHFITYKIVGLILSTGIAGESAFLGKWIGKLAYFLIGAAVVAVLNFITILIV